MTKVVIIDDAEEIAASVIAHTGAEHRRLANKVMEEALARADKSFEEINYVVATGYGRINVPFADRQITELTCHARGVLKILPTARTVIDIGGQDAKALKIVNGKLADFVLSDKCAAGTGRFLEVLSKALGLRLDELGEISMRSRRKIAINSTCTVFGQQEVIAKLSEGEAIEDIVSGLHDAIASRVSAMARRLKIEPDIVFTGGVAKNIGVAKSLGEKLGYEIFIPGEPLLSGALGAALLARETVLKTLRNGGSIQRERHDLEEARFFTDSNRP